MQSKLGSDKVSSNCALLHGLFNRMDIHRFPFDEKEIPLNGIYILFEEGELAHWANRIVRIGTHTGKNQLRSRLGQHFVNENKDRSIFRKNIGRALLNKVNDPFLEDWEKDLTTREAKQALAGKIDADKLKNVEKEVTAYMQNNLSFAAFEVGEKSKRLELESRIISTVSLCEECRPSENWLGLSSPVGKIRESGLWLVNELYKRPFTEIEIVEFERSLKTP